VLWLDDARQDALVPLPANQDVKLVRLDGSHATLRTIDGGISLTLSAEPVLLFYQAKQQGLAEALGTPTISLAATPPAGDTGGTSTFSVQGQGLTAESLRVIGPPLWTTTVKPAGENQVSCLVRGPEATTAREARFYIQRLAVGNIIGELTVPVRVAPTD
jgi:hypothetical protein